MKFQPVIAETFTSQPVRASKLNSFGIRVKIFARMLCLDG